jgi:hypothetical protein
LIFQMGDPPMRFLSPNLGKAHNELDINHIKSQTMGYSFNHVFATLYLLLSRVPWTFFLFCFGVFFPNKLRKFNVCYVTMHSG